MLWSSPLSVPPSLAPPNIASFEVPDERNHLRDAVKEVSRTGLD
jgi:hypothetical protein